MPPKFLLPSVLPSKKNKVLRTPKPRMFVSMLVPFYFFDSFFCEKLLMHDCAMKRPRCDEEEWVHRVTDSAAREVALAEARGVSGGVAYIAASEAKGERALLLARAFAHPRDSRIRFVEATHKYYLDGKPIPISVSGLWARYFSHFDADAALRNVDKWREDQASPYYYLLAYLDRVAEVPREKQGEVIKLVWAANGEQASGAGTFVHRQIELCLNEEPYTGVAPAASRAPVWRLRKKSPFYNLLMYLELVAGVQPSRHEGECRKVCGAMQYDYLAMLLAEQQYDEDNAEFGHYEAWRAAHPELVPVRTEFNVWAEELALAGQIDALMYDTVARHFVVRGRTLEPPRG